MLLLLLYTITILIVFVAIIPTTVAITITVPPEVRMLSAFNFAQLLQGVPGPDEGEAASLWSAAKSP